MNISEKKYDFRKFLNTVHACGLRNPSLKPQNNETEIDESWNIRIAETASDFIINTARDLADYLFVSMNVSVRIRKGGLNEKKSIILRNAEQGKLNVKRSFLFNCDKSSILVEGADERGIAMGSYYIEDLMSLREAPFVEHIQGLLKEPLFSPRMVHSAYGMDIFTGPYLLKIAHLGYDTVLLYVDGIDFGKQGPTDFNTIIDMAEKAGLDVYLYSAVKNLYHPEDERAEEFYNAAYGGLFQQLPKAKGLILVGESCQFPSRDPNTTMTISRFEECCYRSEKHMPGWWPCDDFPLFVKMVRDAVRKVSHDADIVFWTYNWAFSPKELRTKLIDNLPKDVTVELNFELHDNVKTWDTYERALDYTISLTGPSRLFHDEGMAAKQNGLRLYAMSNTGGKTWDLGAVPYMPVPQQWGKRMENLLKARKIYGVSGLMESHHFGMYPSIIAELGKWLFWSNGPKHKEDILRKIAVRDFAEDVADTVMDIWELWSDAVGEFITPIDDQYGPCRVGPSYPFLFSGYSLRQTWGMTMKFPWTVFNKYKILFPVYSVVNDPDGLDMGPRRIKAEVRYLPGTIAKWNSGADRMETLLSRIEARKRPSVNKMIALARYIANTLKTTLHIKEWWLENQRLLTEDDPERAEVIIDRIVTIAEKELENAGMTIPLVEQDSSLGYEPAMDYVTDRAHLEWKIRQLKSVLEFDIPKYRKGIETARSLK
jgi:hypothetical protein